MAEMMKQMEGMAEGGDFQNVLEGMMEQLMSKDILYEPMLDLQNKVPVLSFFFSFMPMLNEGRSVVGYINLTCSVFMCVQYPQWLKDNKDKISAEEYARYEKQYGYVKEIVEFFDRPDFDDKSDTQAKSVIDLMQGVSFQLLVVFISKLWYLHDMSPVCRMLANLPFWLLCEIDARLRTATGRYFGRACPWS